MFTPTFGWWRNANLCQVRCFAYLHKFVRAAELGVQAAAPELDSIVALPTNVDYAPQQSSGPREDKQLLLQVGVVGAPNAGKSTLTNALVGTKVTAVSHKTNTTVLPTLGAFTEGYTQVVLYDTPGVVGSKHYKNPRHAQRVQSAWTTAADCDLLLFVLDAHRQMAAPDPRVEKVVNAIGSVVDGSDARPPAAHEPGPATGRASQQLLPSILVMNKVDLLGKGERPQLLQLADRLCQQHAFQEVFYVSALRSSGVPDLRRYLIDAATPGQWTVAAGSSTDQSPAQLAREIVREKLFHYLHQEVPYDVQVVHRLWQENPDGTVRCEQEILVPNKRVRGIVVGQQGQAIRQIGIAARCELDNALRRTVHLFLKVKVQPGLTAH